MKVPAGRLDRAYEAHREEFETAALRVLRSGWYVMGEELASFERQYADYIGTKSCVGLGNGLDALWIAFKALGIGAGDEVIVQSNAFIACVMGVTINGATPVFVEPNEYFLLDPAGIEDQITSRTKAILVVHLYGQAADMGAVMDIAKRHGLLVVEDCAQSHDATWNGVRTGSFGDIGCFSFYPSKNLGGFGDGGAVTLNDPALNEKVRTIRNYGSQKRYYNEMVGTNSRLDEIQAALLAVRLQYMDEITQERRTLAENYRNGIINPAIALPAVCPGAGHVWHQFVIRSKKRDALKAYLAEKEIGTIIHYPIPPHLSQAYDYLNIPKGALPVAERMADEVLSLPLYGGMTNSEQQYVIDALNGFHG